jgi:hypothetical protein
MKPETGKYYKLNNQSRYIHVYDTDNDLFIVFEEIFMAVNRTRIEARENIPYSLFNFLEITAIQYDRIKRLAQARIDQYKYYAPEALMEEIDREIKPKK